MLGGNILRIISSCEIDCNYRVKRSQGQAGSFYYFLSITGDVIRKGNVRNVSGSRNSITNVRKGLGKILIITIQCVKFILNSIKCDVMGWFKCAY